MHIAMVTRSTAAHGIGGMERHTELLCRELAGQGHQVTVVTTALPPGAEVLASVKNIEFIFCRGTAPGAYSREWWTQSAKKVAKLAPDIVHSQSIGAGGCISGLKERNIPLVMTCHGTPLSDASTDLRTHGFRTNPVHILRTVSYLPRHLQMYGAAARILADTEPIAKHLVSTGLAPRKKITVVLLGVDTDFFRPPLSTHDAPDADGPTGPPVIFSVARVVKDKGFHFLIRAMPDILKQHPDASLVIGGDGPYLPALRELAGKLGIGKNVLFTGRLAEKDLNSHYGSCDLFALATTFVEGFGLVLAEAMACGKPVAASRIGGVTQVVKDNKTGVLFTPGDQKDVTRKLLSMLSDRERLARMGRRARLDCVKRFGGKRMARDCIRVYEEVISSR